jgi:hypothetical protein
MSRDFLSPVIWICEVAMLCAEIVIFGFSSHVGVYAAFYTVAKVPNLNMSLTGLSWPLFIGGQVRETDRVRYKYDLIFRL